MKLEQQLVLRWERSQDSAQDRAYLSAGLSAFTGLNSGFDLAVRRYPRQGVLADPAARDPLWKTGCDPFQLLAFKGNPVLDSQPVDRLLEGEVVADQEPLEQHGLASLTASGRRGTPLSPESGPVVPQKVGENDGQVGRERASALPTRKRSVVIFDELVERPGAELLALVTGQTTAPTQVQESLADQVEVSFEKRLSTRGQSLVP